MENVTRPALLSDHDLMSMMFVTEDGKRPSEKVREFYEDLITDGKLRVAEEVCFDESGHCLHCGYDVTDRSEPRSPEVPPYCHGCGNKIKQPLREQKKKLAVVEEVELVQPDPLVPMWLCSHCDWRNAPSHYTFCPGCGSKIKR